MTDQDLPDLDEIMVQNQENEKLEAQKSQSQPYQTSQPQPYQMSQPQSQSQLYQPSQSQLYQPPQPQPYETSQIQIYESPQPQNYQPSQPQLYQTPVPQNQTSLNINSQVANNIYQGVSNQSPNYVMSPNTFMDNHELFQDDINSTNSRRLKCQLIFAILLLLNIIPSILFLRTLISFNINLLLRIIVVILNLIIVIWMIILTKRGQTTRNIALGIISLISLIICISNIFINILNGYAMLLYDLLNTIILIIITFFNMKCKCCD
jgi:hypothetical protein